MQVSKLIAKLKRNYPELADEPLLDELELAGAADDGEEDEPMDSADFDAPDLGDDQEAEPAPEDGFSMPDLEKEADLMSEEDIEENPGVPAPKGKKKRKPADDEAGDEPVDVNGKY